MYLDENVKEINKKLNSYGYNIFDQNDSFYNDICTKYTTENGTDITLSDRRTDIYDLVSNISLCQKGCNFEYYNSITKKAKCNCVTQEKSSFISNLKEIKNNFFNQENLIDIFSKGLANSNFMIMKYYKLALSFKDHLYNYGCIIMTILFLLFIIFMIKFCIKDHIKINIFILIIINEYFPYFIYSNNVMVQNQILNNKKKLKDNKKENKSNENIKKFNKRNSGKKEETKKIISAPLRKSKFRTIKLELKNGNDSLNRIRNKSLNFNKNINIQFISNNNIKNQKNKIYQKNEANQNNKKHKVKSRKNHIKNIKQKQKIVSSLQSYDKLNIISENIDINEKKNEILNDQELNSLEYNSAIKYDKRTYFEYYCSLLKKKHLIFFSFIPTNDYNIISIKICLFFISFSLYFTINGFFFTDETMHNIYINNGTIIHFINQLPKILYSSIISILIQQILKLLCLSENNILKIKKENKIEIAKGKSKTIRRCLLIKFILFYILGFCLMIFFWYFITCFCAVYTNTQIILIKDTFLSFGLSMLYPFTINLLPGLFRISALRAHNKDKKCIYIIGQLVALF